MKVNLEQFFSSLCVKTLCFGVIQLLLNCFITLKKKRKKERNKAMRVQLQPLNFMYCILSFDLLKDMLISAFFKINELSLINCISI